MVVKEENSKFREEKGGWRSERDEEVGSMFCGRCCTDKYVRFL